MSWKPEVIFLDSRMKMLVKQSQLIRDKNPLGSVRLAVDCVLSVLGMPFSPTAAPLKCQCP